jgi:hypothetical protein
MRAPNVLAIPEMGGQAQQVYYDANGQWQWSPYAVDGATRPDSFTGMQPEFNTALEQMFASAPPEIRSQLQVMSGYRSPERQAELWAAALEKYGSPEAARQWVAPPGNSQHNHGNAADLRYLDPAAREWAHANAAAYGLAFPLGHEPWHIELATARGGQPNAPQGAAPQGRPAMPGQMNTQPGNALAMPDMMAAETMRREQQQQAYNALMQGLQTPIYTNQLTGFNR